MKGYKLVCHVLLVSVKSVSTIVNAVVVDDGFLLTCSKVGDDLCRACRNVSPQHIRRYTLGGSVQ